MAIAPILAGLILLVVPSAHAGVGLTISPSRNLLEIAPGGSETVVLHATNNSEDWPVMVRAYAWDYWHGEEGRYTSPPGTTPRSGTSWIQIVPREAAVAPGGSVEILATVSVPA